MNVPSASRHAIGGLRRKNAKKSITGVTSGCGAAVGDAINVSFFRVLAEIHQTKVV